MPVDSENEFVSLVTTDEAVANTAATEEIAKGHGLPVRVEHIGDQFHVVVTYKP